MLRRTVVNVATTPHYMRGQSRLAGALKRYGAGCDLVTRVDSSWPWHNQIPYAFKAYALRDLWYKADLLLWADASVLPIRDMESLWQRIERDGYWMAKNAFGWEGFSNYTWTGDTAYPYLFPKLSLEAARDVNRAIPHVVATCFGLNLQHTIGRAFLDEYYQLASETPVFCGPWWNSNYSGPNMAWRNQQGAQPCGPSDVGGHRHDQTVASVIAWRMGLALTMPPKIITYQGCEETEDTILVVDGSINRRVFTE